MDNLIAIAALSALAHPQRLAMFRLLITAGQDGLLAGEIAAGAEALQNTASTNLAILTRAGLIQSRREGRAVRYFVHIPYITELFGFLLQDCCDGRPEICSPLVDRLSCCLPSETGHDANV